MQFRRSAEPDLDVEALLPCLAIKRRDEARMEEVVEILNVLWESPPVPTMSTRPPLYLPSFLPRDSTTSRRDSTSTLAAALNMPAAVLESISACLSRPVKCRHMRREPA